MSSAYLQASLKAEGVKTVDTWVEIPRERWPEEWIKKGYKRPVVQLRLALYGHPLSGVFWERHCQKALFSAGWTLIEGWESTYRHERLGLVLSIYVDDFKMAGRAENLAKGWASITNAGIRIDPPTPLGHFPWVWGGPDDSHRV